MKTFFKWNHDCCLSVLADSFEGLASAGYTGFVEAAEGFDWLGNQLKFNFAAGLGDDVPVLLDAEFGADVGIGSGFELGDVDRTAPPEA